MSDESLERHDLRRRLRRLGVVKGTRHLAVPSPRRKVAIESLVEGQFHETEHGQCFVAHLSYPLDHHHGVLPLRTFLELPPSLVAELSGEPALLDVDLRRAVFLDTETTGLSGGTGTMAFLVGLGYFEDDHFHLLQAFLRDPGDEPAMIVMLDELLPRFEALVSFNGRGFDVPILETRFILARRPCSLSTLPHLDLLGPARRMWRWQLDSCALGSLEREVLGVQRDQADVPGGVIPYIYRDYLRTGDAREISRVLYHNQVDVLSMVTLAARLGHIFSDPWHDPQLQGANFYALSRWCESEEESERMLRRALDAGLPAGLRIRAMGELALHLKRTERRAQAVEWWQQLALEDEEDVAAAVELAMHFEWQVPDLKLAIGWTRFALTRAEGWHRSTKREGVLAELRHRLARLERKLGRAD
jgi:hypothetical protein